MSGRIDTHNHLWHFGGRDSAWINDDMQPLQRDFLISELRATLQQNGVDQCLLVQVLPVYRETRWLLEIADQNPVVAGVIGWCDITQGAAIEPTLASLQATSSRLKGIRYMSQNLPPEHLLDPAFIAGVQAVGRAGLVYELLLDASQLDAARRLIEHCPDVRFVVEHCAKPRIRQQQLSPWREELAAIASSSDKVFCKVSGLVTEADWQHWRHDDLRPYIEHAFDAFGGQRVLYGSDWPVCLLAAPYAEVMGIWHRLFETGSDVQPDDFFSNNARRLYALDGAQESHP